MLVSIEEGGIYRVRIKRTTKSTWLWESNLVRNVFQNFCCNVFLIVKERGRWEKNPFQSITMQLIKILMTCVACAMELEFCGRK